MNSKVRPTPHELTRAGAVEEHLFWSDVFRFYDGVPIRVVDDGAPAFVALT